MFLISQLTSDGSNYIVKATLNTWGNLSPSRTSIHLAMFAQQICKVQFVSAYSEKSAYNTCGCNTVMCCCRCICTRQ